MKYAEKRLGTPQSGRVRDEFERRAQQIALVDPARY
jgi:hypothetical protein